MRTSAARVYVKALSIFFCFGALVSGFSVLTLLFPAGPLDVLWRINPTGHSGLLQAGAMGVMMMVVVCVLCIVTARGVSRFRRWGLRLAVMMLAVNLVADGVNGILGDHRTLVGIPIAVLMIGFLLSPTVRALFRTAAALP